MTRPRHANRPAVKAVRQDLRAHATPAERLAVELDGAVHADPLRQRYDDERTDYMNTLDIRVLRFESRKVLETPDVVVAAIAEAFEVESPSWIPVRSAQPGGDRGGGQKHAAGVVSATTPPAGTPPGQEGNFLADGHGR